MASQNETSDLSDYTESAGHQPGSRSWIGRAAVLVPVLAVAAVALAFSGNRDNTATPAASPESSATASSAQSWWRVGRCELPSTPPDKLTPEQSEAAKAASEQTSADIERTGFARSHSLAQDGTYICGWKRIPRNIDEQKEVGDPNRGESILDAPDGKEMGRSFPHLGYFTLEEISAPGFDPAGMRVQRYGCDPIGSEACSPTSTILKPNN